MSLPEYLALASWLALHYVTGLFRISGMMQRPLAQRPMFIIQHRIHWHTPLWIHIVGSSILWLFAKAVMSWWVLWKLWDWIF